MHLLCASLRLDFTRIYRRKTPSSRKFDTHKLRDVEIRGQFVERLKDREVEPRREDQSTRTGITSKGSSQTSHKKFSATRKISGDYNSDETWKTIEERKEIKIKRCAESNPQRIRELDQVYNRDC